MKKVAVIMGSDSDLPVVEKCIDELKKYGIPTEVHVYSAHRTPDEAIGFAKTAEENGFGVIISAAGKAAHLGGVLAANTVLPVVGIPIKASALDGMDALFRCHRESLLHPLQSMAPRMQLYSQLKFLRFQMNSLESSSEKSARRHTMQ